jgi:hypothetical protein
MMMAIFYVLVLATSLPPPIMTKANNNTNQQVVFISLAVPVVFICGILRCSRSNYCCKPALVVQ